MKHKKLIIQLKLVEARSIHGLAAQALRSYGWLTSNAGLAKLKEMIDATDAEPVAANRDRFSQIHNCPNCQKEPINNADSIIKN